MSYHNINRKCSVCQCCGMCDYEYEINELGEISGDYNPMMASLMYKESSRMEKED